MSKIERLYEKIEFIRHIPARQLARRLYLSCRKIYLIKFVANKPLSLPAIPTTIRADLALPRLTAPHGTLGNNAGQWEATFLHRTRQFSDAIEWQDIHDDAATQLWRMNLHYFEYLPDTDQATAEYLIEDWITKCRPFSSSSLKASWTPYAVSLRISAWLAFISENGLPANQNLAQLISASIEEQAHFLVKHLETDVLGNHVIKNLRALYEAAYAFEFDARTKPWLQVADYWLNRELTEQVLADGVHYELSPSYNTQVFADLLAISAVCRDQTLHSKLASTINRMVQPLVDLCHPDGQVAQFNDAGLNMTISVKEVLAVYEQLFDQTAPTAQKHFAYPQAGFYGLRTSETYIVIKMGKLGPDKLMAHAHGDWGSFEWSHSGQRVIVDQGVFEYIAGQKRNQSRSTSSHNTLVSEFGDQASFIGAFRCAFRPRPDSVDFQPISDGFNLTGALQLRNRAKHSRVSRTLVFKNNTITITDTATDSNQVVSHFLLHPDWTSTGVQNNTVRWVNNSGQSIKFELLTDQSTLTTNTAPWWPNMGQELSTNRVTAICSLAQQIIRISAVE